MQSWRGTGLIEKGRLYRFPYGNPRLRTSPYCAFHRVYQEFLDSGQPVGKVSYAIFDATLPPPVEFEHPEKLPNGELLLQAHLTRNTPRVLGSFALTPGDHLHFFPGFRQRVRILADQAGPSDEDRVPHHIHGVLPAGRFHVGG